MAEWKRWLQDQRGMTLLELVVAMPLLTVMLLSLGTAFLMFLRLYFYNLSDMELQEQMRLAAVDIVTDITYADRVEIREDTVEIWTRRRIDAQKQITYTLKSPLYLGKITKDSQPLTGDSMLGDIRITKFHCAKINERTIRIDIEGQNRTTGKILAIETAAVMRNAAAADRQ